MKKFEKKLLRAMHDATLDGRLEWSLYGCSEFRAKLPTLGILGVPQYTAIMEYGDSTPTTISICSESGDWAHTLRASGRKTGIMIADILSQAMSTELGPEVVLKLLTDALVAETISCDTQPQPESFGYCVSSQPQPPGYYDGRVEYKNDSFPANIYGVEVHNLCD